MRIVDTNVFVAYFSRHDHHHAISKKLNLSGAFTNELVFSEVANVLERRLGAKKEVMDAIRTAHREVPMQRTEERHFEAALNLLEAHFKKISFTDCTLLVHAKEKNCPLVTFDRALGKVAKETGIQVEPVQPATASPKTPL